MTPPPADASRTENARAKILRAARDLFNEHGTAAVSTNHIAERASVSPGNLYYWFRNKPAIISALFDEWSAASAPVTPADDSPAALLRALLATEAQNSAVASTYRGLSRDLLPLLHADAELAERYRENFRARSAALTAAAQQLVSAGFLRSPGGAEELGAFVSAFWVLTEFSAPFAEVVHGVVPPERPQPLAGTVLAGMLTDTGRAALAAAAKEVDA